VLGSEPSSGTLTSPVHQIANFLALVQKDRDLGQAGLGIFRSAISNIHVGFDGLPIGKVTVISNLIKGVGNLDLPRKARKPRYQTTWEIAPVLEALAELHPSESFSLMEFSMKTLTLTTLATISRASTLAIMARRFSMGNNAMEGNESQLYGHFLPRRQEKTGRFRDGLSVSEEPSLTLLHTCCTIQSVPLHS